MKALKYMVIIIAAAFCSSSLFAQTGRQNKETTKATNQAELKKAIESRNYNFMAQYIQPLGGGQHYLNYNYDVRIRPDSVIAYLPYFGTVQFAPPYNPTDDGVKFTSTKFDYQTAVKKGKYTITITLKDAGYNRRLILTTSDAGYASLQVLITNRTPVFFTGYVTPVKDKTDAAAADVTAKLK